MTDDDRAGFEPQDAPDDAGDPAAAFEALRRTVEKQGGQIGAEMTVIRRGVEAAFDQFEKFQQPTDYGPDLGRIAAALIARIQTTGTAGNRHAGNTTRTGSIICPSDSRKADHALRLKPDHPIGAGHTGIPGRPRSPERPLKRAPPLDGNSGRATPSLRSHPAAFSS